MKELLIAVGILALFLAIKISVIVAGFFMGGFIATIGLYYLIKFLTTEIPDEPQGHDS